MTFNGIDIGYVPFPDPWFMPRQQLIAYVTGRYLIFNIEEWIQNGLRSANRVYYSPYHGKAISHDVGTKDNVKCILILEGSCDICHNPGSSSRSDILFPYHLPKRVSILYSFNSLPGPSDTEKVILKISGRPKPSLQQAANFSQLGS